MAKIEIPPCPSGLLPSIQADWKTFWASAVAMTLTASDLPQLRRLFALMDERQRLFAQHKKRRSERKAAQIHGYDVEIRALEDRLGIGPKARLELGLSVAKYQLAKAQLQALSPEEQGSDALDELAARRTERLAG